MIKECRKHGLTDFSEGKRPRCRKCLVEAVSKRRKKVKQLAVEYKGGCCLRCGYNKCIDALDFHHISPSEKEFSISSSGHCRSWTTVKTELDKCILVCANCHREIHAEVA